MAANLALLGAIVLLARYVRIRWPEATAEQRGLVLALFGLWPLGLFFRMPYSESLFVCGTLAVLNGMARGWPLLALALLTGFVTAVRPVGVALTAAYVWYICTRTGPRRRAKFIHALLLSPVACWGLLAYVAYQWLAFDAPFGFAQTQQHWDFLAPEDRSWLAKVQALVTLEPIWDVYVPSSQRYWGNVGSPGARLFYLHFWNPILFLLAITLLVWGGRRRWLTGSELILGAGLLAIPYATRAFEMSMAGHGRFAAVVVVNYLVLGRMLAHFSSLVAAALCSALTLFLFTLIFRNRSPDPEKRHTFSAGVLEAEGTLGHFGAKTAHFAGHLWHFQRPGERLLARLADVRCAARPRSRRPRPMLEQSAAACLGHAELPRQSRSLSVRPISRPVWRRPQFLLLELAGAAAAIRGTG